MKFDEFIKILNVSFPELESSQIEKFRAMEAEYEDWNSKINVISRKDIGCLYSHHVLHSLSIAEYLKTCRKAEYERLSVSGDCNILDIGTGGGFPGIPLAILFPKTHFTLCDSIGKKVLVTSEISKSLNLRNVTAIKARAEELDQKFDYIVSRAVTSLDNFYPWTKGKYSERILYLKGGDINEEISAAMHKFRFTKHNISTWKISSWIKDEYYNEKFVIDIK